MGWVGVLGGGEEGGGNQLICYLFLYVSMEGEKDMEAGEPRGVEEADSGGHVTKSFESI